MKRTALVSLLLCAASLSGFCAAPVEVADKSLRIEPINETIFYYAFDAGDKVDVSIAESSGKPVTIEIAEMPDKIQIQDKSASFARSFTSARRQAYKFTIANLTLGMRTVSVKISRTPASDAGAGFDTEVTFRTVRDTVWRTEQEQYVVSADTAFPTLLNTVIKVHSSGYDDGNKANVFFTLPEGTISWGYYIGVDDEGKQAMEEATKRAENAISSISSAAGFGPVAEIALSGYSFFKKVDGSENVIFEVLDRENYVKKTQGNEYKGFRFGDVISEANKLRPIKGMIYITMENDNLGIPIDVTLNVAAVVVNNKYGTRSVRKFTVSEPKNKYFISQK